jgi:small subunit ribosomal protein S8
MVGDKVANLINGLKNASKVGKDDVTLPYTKMTHSIADLLKKEEYVSDVEVVGKVPKQSLKITLKYDNGEPVIHNTKRVSKFSKRVYKGAKYIQGVKRGFGTAVITTPEGILTDAEAKKRGIGGEILFYIW